MSLFLKPSSAIFRLIRNAGRFKGLGDKEDISSAALSIRGNYFSLQPRAEGPVEPDETRYAVVAREMRDSGDWIVPHLNGEIYAEKPPLFFWLVNLSTFFFGENSELTNRLPSALAGLFAVLVTFVFAKRLFNEKAGLFSGLALATCLLFPQVSRWMVLDSLLVLLFLMATFFLHHGFYLREKRRKDYLLAGLFMGLGS